MIKDNSSDEHELIARLKKGDRSAFAEMVEQYSTAIYRIGWRFTNNALDAEDVLQETFIKAYKALPDFEGRSSLATWLYRIAVNESLMTLRKHNPNMVSIDEKVSEDDTDESENDLAMADWCCLPEDVLLSDEARKFLDDTVGKLPDSLRSVFILRDIEGLSIRETANTLGLTETNVKTRLLRARMRLRQDLTRYFGKQLVEGVKDD